MVKYRQFTSDCLRTAVGCILEITPFYLPYITNIDDMIEWLEQQGYDTDYVSAASCTFYPGCKRIRSSYQVGIVYQLDRPNDSHHAVVCYEGRVVHNPNKHDIQLYSQPYAYLIIR